MKMSCLPKCRLTKLLAWLQIILGGLVVVVSLSSLFVFYSAGFLIHREDICRHIYGVKEVIPEGFDVRALSDRVDEILDKLDSLQEKLESKVQQMERNKDVLSKLNVTMLEYKKYLEDE
ncbi:hypothetical protein CRG98_028081, partial [Punica granatum]